MVLKTRRPKVSPNHNNGSADKNSHKDFFNRLGKKLGYKCMNDWYTITIDDLRKNGAYKLVSSYEKSPIKTLQSIYPKHKWEPWKFAHLKWVKFSDHKSFMDWLGTELGYKTLDDWYNVTTEAICSNGGQKLLHLYENSPVLALQNIYPEHIWELGKFKLNPNKIRHKGNRDIRKILSLALNRRDGYTSEQLLTAIDWLGDQLSIQSLDDWYRVGVKQVQKCVPLNSRRDLGAMLQGAYPQHQWNMKLFGDMFHMKSAQKKLFTSVKNLFPAHGVEEDYQHPEMIHSSLQKMELDVYIEELKLAFEYQGEQHYHPVYNGGHDFTKQIFRDQEKRRACRQHNITLIEVPYWWDNTKESLAATVHLARPELIPNPPGVEPIPTENPLESNSLPLSHGYPWDEHQDVTGWWMSEKMDGFRAYWNSSELLSRQGKPIGCPSWFTASLPHNISLDGELWLGQGTSHEQIAKVIKSKSGDWELIKYCLFDVPSSPGIYEERMEEMEAIRSVLDGHISVVKNIKCTGMGNLVEFLDEVVAAKGEGVIVRQPLRTYQIGYTPSLLKVKKYLDTEVKVMAVLEGGLLCQQLNGLECVVRDYDVSSVPPLGSTIVIKYNGAHSTGALKNPVFWRRLDSLPGKQAPDWRDPKNHKEFFDQLAQVMNVSQPSDWYQVTKEDVTKNGGEKLLAHYSDSIYEALRSCYPDIIFFPWLFQGSQVPIGYWHQSTGQRDYMEWLYAQLGFKSMNDWYHLTRAHLLENGGSSLITYHKGSPSLILQKVYPEHNWQLEQFRSKPKQLWTDNSAKRKEFAETKGLAKIPWGYWQDTNHRVEFFHWLGAQLGHKSMDDWYKVTKEDFIINGGSRVLDGYYNNSPSYALQCVYPEHKWHLDKFTWKPHELTNRPPKKNSTIADSMS